MSKKHIIWIDDYPFGIQAMAKKLFPKLWDKGLDSTVLFFGDYYKGTKKAPEFDTSDCNDTIEELIEYALLKCGFDRMKSNENLLSKVNELSNGNDIVLRIFDSIKIINNESAMQVINADASLDYTATVIDSITEEIYSIITNRLSETGCDKAIVAIDMMLIFGDNIRLNENKAILSVYLYGKIKEKGCDCLLYSAYDYQEKWINSWKEQYSTIFNGEKISDCEPISREDAEKLFIAIDSLGGASDAE